MNIYVEKIIEEVSKNLGRSAASRKVKNSDGYYINDPVFSYIQLASRNEVKGYRVGFYYEVRSRDLYFSLIHSPESASIFKKNFVFSVFCGVVKKTAKFRSDNWLMFSSRSAFKKLNKGEIEFSTDTVNDLLQRIRSHNNDTDLQSDLFPTVPNTGKKLKSEYAVVAGNTFNLLLAQKLDVENISKVIEYSWPLFVMLYPQNPSFKRDANLARNLQVKIPKRQCEFIHIKSLPKDIKSLKCKGRLEAAHIKAHQFGGSDRFDNGLWLCSLHHRLTEGKIKGWRDDKIDVTFFL